jgi:hypothetical protein
VDTKKIAGEMKNLVTDAELQKLIEVTLLRGPATEDELQQVFDWAHDVRADAATLRLVLQGKLVPQVDGSGEVMFHYAEALNARRS